MMASCYSPVHGFIYDTLTLSNDAMPTFSPIDEDSGELLLPEPSVSFNQEFDVSLPERVRNNSAKYHCKVINNEKVWRTIEHYNGRLPYLDKSTVSYFIKKGRERYNSHYRREIAEGVRSRCNIRYFGALEYGPLWARPHVHICVFGVNRADWVRFWAKYWRREMGFTKTKFISLLPGDKNNLSHCSRVSTYISKYLLKGSEENPVVRLGLCPAAWRICSHGIGEEYLTTLSGGRFAFLTDDIKYQMGNRVPVDGNNNSEIYQDIVKYCQKFNNLAPEQISALKTYVKDGYKSALPRYYRDRLLATHSKGLAGCAIKTALLEDACDDHFEKILQYTTECNFFPGKSGEGLRHYLEHDLRAFNFACYRYRAYKKIQAVRSAEWHRLSSLNSARRLRAKPNTGDLGLLL